MSAILGRVAILSLALSLAVFVSSTAYAEGLTWIIADGYSPLLSCPEHMFNTGQGGEGYYCAMQLSYKDTTISTIQNNPELNASCKIPATDDSGPINCHLYYSCDQACQYNGGSCPDPSTLPATNTFGSEPAMCTISTPGVPVANIACKQIELQSYCDSSFEVTPGSIVGMRGLIAGCVVIILVWTIGEFVLRSVEIGLRKEAAYGRLRQSETLPAVKAELRSVIERRWAEQYDASKRETGLMAGSVYGSDSPKVALTPMGSSYTPRSAYGGSPRGQMFRSTLESRNPQRRFESSAWQRRLTQWKELRSKKSSMFKSRVLIRSVFLNILFFGTIVATMYLIIYISPSKVPANRSIVSTLTGDVSLWEIHSWLDALIFVDVLLDVFMFLLACCVVHWPRAPVFAKRVQADRFKQEMELENEVTRKHSIGNRSLVGPTPDTEGSGSISLSMSDLSSKNLVADEDAFSLESVLKQTMTADTCLMIACHQSCLTEEKESAFTNTLKSAMKVFPPSHIFVCDNGNAMTPVDNTPAVARAIHPDINYLYVPEGNKTFAFYWCNRYWIPFLAQCDRVPDFKYALMTDDDVPLPADLHIPHEYLRLHAEVKAVHFAITAATPDGNPNILVRCQDIEYKMAAVHKYFQSSMARALSCHGAIALWERSTLDRVFYDHDTVFHGEDLYMGLALLRLRDDSRIISCPQTIVPTYAPDTWGMLFRQRVKSWELTSHKKTFTYLFEFIHPASFCHAASLVLKPYFLQELLTITLDWLRMFLLAGLLLRDWLGLILMTALFTAILYLQVTILQLIYMRQRPDLRSSFSTILTFPFYRLSGLLFRLCALIHNILVYSHDRKAIKIGVREDEVRDIPPSPPHPDCDWFTCWTGESTRQPETNR